MKSSYVSCRWNSPNLSEVQFTENSKKGCQKFLTKTFYEPHTTFAILTCLKGFLLLVSKKLYSLSHNFFTWKIKCQRKVTGPLVWSSLELGKRELEVVLYGSQNVFHLILKKKLLPLRTELVVTLNHVGVIHLWRPQNMTNYVTPNRLHLH